MTNRHAYALGAIILATTLGGAGVRLTHSHNSAQAIAGDLPSHPNAESKDRGVVVELCDGVTKLEIPGLKPGQQMSRAQAQAAARKLMAEWERKHPGEHWQLAQDEAQPSHAAEPSPAPLGTPDETSPAGAPAANLTTAAPHPSQTAAAPAASATSAQQPANEQGAEVKKQETEKKAEQAGKEAAGAGEGKKSLPGPGRKGGFKVQQGDTYASFNQRDYMVWKAETDKFVQKGKEIFHDANKLGSTIGISCDMCHPDAANTHPETYPKYQVQLQRVALLRDMIDWCIENPIKGKTMTPDDERLRALEAYILAQRKGAALDYGKH